MTHHLSTRRIMLRAMVSAAAMSAMILGAAVAHGQTMPASAQGGPAGARSATDQVQEELRPRGTPQGRVTGGTRGGGRARQGSVPVVAAR